VLGGACSTYGGQQRCMQGFGGKLEGKEPLGNSRHRWKDNIKMDLQEVECGGHLLDRSGSGYGQVVGTYECVD